MITVDGPRLLEDLETLRGFGRKGRGVERVAFEADDRAAREWLVQRMAQAGLDAHIDGIGNVHGRAPAARAILVGSHVDTVPDGGWLDGALGVAAGLEAARTLNGGGEQVGIDVVAFADEEGTFRGTLGSRAFCGELDAAEIDASVDGAGRRLLDALAACGWAGRPIAMLDRDRHRGYVELHIEQGPVLHGDGAAIGVVTGIVGMRRLLVTFHGRADHAGTTPMADRRDAGAAAIALAAGFDALMREAGSADTVWNVGAMDLQPGFGNVVPHTACATLEYRDLDEAILTAADARLHRLCHELADARGLELTIAMIVSMPAAAMDPDLAAYLASAADEVAGGHRAMPSGAGHDAMVVARHVPAAMLFVPSIDGRSHHQLEDTRPQDIVLGAEVLTRALASIQIQSQQPEECQA